MLISFWIPKHITRMRHDLKQYSNKGAKGIFKVTEGEGKNREQLALASKKKKQSPSQQRDESSYSLERSRSA